MKQQKFKRHRFFHFTTHFVHSKWFDMKPYRNWLDFVHSLREVQNSRPTEDIVWHSGVLMSNHMHLLFSIDGYNEHSLILDLERALKKELDVKSQLFQRPLPCEPLLHLEHVKSAYKYIYRNPVEARMVKRVEDYPYSSLFHLLNKQKPSVQHPFVDPFCLIQNLPDRLRWLNSFEGSYSQVSFDFYKDQGLGF